MATKVTEHFTLEEMAATSHKDLQQANDTYAENRMWALINICKLLEEARTVLGCPLIISSGVRCPELNERVGGAKNSQHMRCEAADFVPKGHSVEEAFEILHKSSLRFDQLILEYSGKKSWLHISCSQAPRRESLIYDKGKYKKYKG